MGGQSRVYGTISDCQLVPNLSFIKKHCPAIFSTKCMIKQRIELILVSVYKSVCNVRSVKGDLSWTAATGSRQREEKLQQQQR